MLESNTPKTTALAEALEAPAPLAWKRANLVGALIEAATCATTAAPTPKRAEAVVRLQALARNNVP